MGDHSKKKTAAAKGAKQAEKPEATEKEANVKAKKAEAEEKTVEKKKKKKTEEEARKEETEEEQEDEAEGNANKSEDDSDDSDSSEDEKAKKKKTRARKLPKKKKGALVPASLENLAYIVVFIAIGYYKGWQHVIMHWFQEATGTSPAVAGAVEASMTNCRNGKPIDLMDLQAQLRHYCYRPERQSCLDYVAELPQVAQSVKDGPGTWNRKPLSKDVSMDIDGTLAAIASGSKGDAAREPLRVLMKELMSATGSKKARSSFKLPALLQARPGEE